MKNNKIETWKLVMGAISIIYIISMWVKKRYVINKYATIFTTYSDKYCSDIIESLRHCISCITGKVVNE